MKELDQRIALAKIERPEMKFVNGHGLFVGRLVMIPKSDPDNPYTSDDPEALERVEELPQLTDLNFLSRVRAKLTKEQQQVEYFSQLKLAVARDMKIKVRLVRKWDLVNATAPQQAEAMLRACGVWREE